MEAVRYAPGVACRAKQLVLDCEWLIYEWPWGNGSTSECLLHHKSPLSGSARLAPQHKAESPARLGTIGPSNGCPNTDCDQEKRAGKFRSKTDPSPDWRPYGASALPVYSGTLLISQFDKRHESRWSPDVRDFRTVCMGPLRLRLEPEDREMRGAGLAETHCSIVVFAGDRAYKLKKPVKFAFLDFSTRAAREAACRREVKLNRRIAPDVYLGVADVVGPEGAVCDHLVVMRRMPEERRLATLVEQGAPLMDHLRRIARTIAAFHARAETSPAIGLAATRDAVLANWEQSFGEMRPFYGSVLDRPAAMRVEVLVRRYLAGRQPLFDERIAHGFVRDGHGDLKSEDIFCLDDYPRILDCVEFDDRLRHGDVLADVAFLAMDLERLGVPTLAERFLGWYEEFSGTRSPASLSHHYIAYRAHIRAKVACLRRAQGGDGSEDPAKLLELTRRHLEAGVVSLVLVGGLPGTGKSTLAAAVGRAKGWAVLRSDEIRKQQGALAATDPGLAPWERGLYTPARTRATYKEVLRRARTALERGESVILDASWNDPQWRLAAARVAAETSSDLVALECQAPTPVANARLAARKQGGDASDATAETHARMARIFAAWPWAATIDTTGEPRASLASALEAITSQAVVSAVLPSDEPYPVPAAAAS
jgi:uncharacterized protein